MCVCGGGGGGVGGVEAVYISAQPGPGAPIGP